MKSKAMSSPRWLMMRMGFRPTTSEAAPSNGVEIIVIMALMESTVPWK